MIASKRRRLFVELIFGFAILACCLPAASVRAGTYYWDANGTTAGAGAAPSGTWGTGAIGAQVPLVRRPQRCTPQRPAIICISSRARAARAAQTPSQ